MEKIKQKIDEEIGKRGLKMSKMIHPGSSGFLSFTPPLYDRKTAYSYKNACDLGEEGFRADGSQEIAILILNALMK